MNPPIFESGLWSLKGAPLLGFSKTETEMTWSNDPALSNSSEGCPILGLAGREYIQALGVRDFTATW
jgi:hypothetical protein